jgi:hypothetical protein
MVILQELDNFKNEILNDSNSLVCFDLDVLINTDKVYDIKNKHLELNFYDVTLTYYFFKDCKTKNNLDIAILTNRHPIVKKIIEEKFNTNVLCRNFYLDDYSINNFCYETRSRESKDFILKSQMMKLEYINEKIDDYNKIYLIDRNIDILLNYALHRKVILVFPFKY